MTSGSGFWTIEENCNFERGVILHGWSSWTKIHKTCVTTRTSHQIKSHAQKFPQEKKEHLIAAHNRRLRTTPSPSTKSAPPPKKPSAILRRTSAPLKKRAPRRTSVTPTQTVVESESSSMKYTWRTRFLTSALHKNHAPRTLERSTGISSDEKDESFRQTSLSSNATIVKLVSNVDDADSDADKSAAVSTLSQNQRSSSPEDWKAMLAEMNKPSTRHPKNEDDLAVSIHSAEGKVSPSLSSESVTKTSDEYLPEYKPPDDETQSAASLDDASAESVPRPPAGNSGNDLLTDAYGLLHDIKDLPPVLPPSVAIIRARITVDKSIYDRIVKELSASPDYNNNLEYTVLGRGGSSRTPKHRESLMRIRLNEMMKQHEGLRWWCPGVAIATAHFNFCLDHIIAVICVMHDHPTWSAVSSGGTANTIFDEGDEVCEVGHRILGLFRRVSRGLAKDGYAKLGKCGRETCEDIARIVDYIEKEVTALPLVMHAV